MLQDAYSPDTDEHIPTDNPAAWMLRAGVAAPAYESSISGCFWRNGAWVIISALPQILIDAQTKQITSVTDSCGASILAGFQSSALGAPYNYPAKAIDQSNLIGCVTASHASGLASTWTCNFWCKSASGIWALVPHTAAQIQQVLADGLAARETFCSKLLSLLQQIEKATTVAAVQAIIW